MRPAVFILLLVSVSALAGCGSEEQEKRIKPPGIISRDSMAMHISNLHRLEGISRSREIRTAGMQSNAKYLFIEYFDSCGTTAEKFSESLVYWKDDLEDMNAIYDDAIEILSTRMAKVKTERAAREAEEEEAKVEREEAREERAQKQEEKQAEKRAKEEERRRMLESQRKDIREKRAIRKKERKTEKQNN